MGELSNVRPDDSGTIGIALNRQAVRSKIIDDPKQEKTRTVAKK